MVEKIKFAPVLKGSDALAKRIGRKLFSPYQILLSLTDLLVVYVAFSTGMLISGFSVFFWETTTQSLNLLILTLVVLAFFPAYSLYSYHHLFLRREHFLRVLKSFAWGFLASALVFTHYAYPGLLSGETSTYGVVAAALVILVLSRFYWNYLIYLVMSIGVSFLAIGALALVNAGEKPLVMEASYGLAPCTLLALGFALVNRYFWVHVVFGHWMRRLFRKQLAIVGTDQEAGRITHHIISNNAPFWVSGFVTLHKTQEEEVHMSKSRLGEIKDLPSIIQQQGIDDVVVTDENIDKALLVSLLDYCTSEGVTVWFPPKVMPIIDVKLYIDSFCGLPLIRLCSQKHNWLFNKMKHFLDAVVAVPLFLVLLPVFAVIAAAIKANSPGPVFYRARAIGKGGREFTLFKFRSMKVGDSSDIHKQYVTKLIKGEISQEGSEDQVFKIKDDPRITTVGKLLRKLSFDELPQILNVLKGDMSLVGPRPCLPYEYEIYKDWHKKRLSIRPGVSGLWQVAGRSAVTFEDMVLLDLYYIYNRSLLMDMNIVYETVFVVLKKKGAY
ncbi:MAG: sugar transferase [Deltaproteobacteria bacterium]|nr:sugar transferase [Deltaproteobacteria bacterium]